MEVFRAVLEITFYNVAKLNCHGRLNGLNVSRAMAFNARFSLGEKNRKVTNLENMVQAATE
jgi:hypothetical protein